MAYGRFYRRYRRYRRWRRRRFYRRRRFGRAPINNSQRSRCRIRINNSCTTTLTVPAADDHSYTMGILPFCQNNEWATAVTAQGKISGICSLVDTPLYTAMANLYDEVKIDSMVVSVTLLSPLAASVGSNAITFHTAWDRKNAYHENMYYSGVVQPGEGFWPGYQHLTQYSSHMTAIATTNSIPKIVRSCAASDLLERIQFIDTDHNPHVANRPLAGETRECHMNLPWYSSDSHSPCFSPAFFMCIALGAATVAEQNFPVSVQVSYTCTFRNPKFGGSSGARARGDMPVPAQRGLPPDDGMDDGNAPALRDPVDDGMDENLSGVDVAAQQAAEAGVPDGELDRATMGEMARDWVRDQIRDALMPGMDDFIDLIQAARDEDANRRDAERRAAQDPQHAAQVNAILEAVADGLPARPNRRAPRPPAAAVVRPRNRYRHYGEPAAQIRHMIADHFPNLYSR